MTPRGPSNTSSRHGVVVAKRLGVSDAWVKPPRRAAPPDDERVRATVLAIANELTQDGLVLRHRVEHTDEGGPGQTAA